MGTFVLKRKTYTVYDDTDNLKRLNDADILAERKKSAPGWGSVISQTLGGALMGATAAAGYKGIKGLAEGQSTKDILSSIRGTNGKGGLTLGRGALLGGLFMGIKALNNRNKVARANEYYNDRLAYAQRQALRRERQDFRANMTRRDGYSYGSYGPGVYGGYQQPPMMQQPMQ